MVACLFVENHLVDRHSVDIYLALLLVDKPLLCSNVFLLNVFWPKGVELILLFSDVIMICFFLVSKKLSAKVGVSTIKLFCSGFVQLGFSSDR
jgi:hypothetical protein